MKHRLLTGLAGVASLLALTGAPALAEVEKARLVGFQEVPALSTTGQGKCTVRINQAETQIEVTVSYSDLVADVTQSHIHFGQRGVNGGVSIWLCSNLNPNPAPAGTPSCPGPHSGTVTDVINASNVVGPAAQGIDPGELGEIIEAIRSGVAYCNVHSTKFPAGEIRGQLKPSFFFLPED